MRHGCTASKHLFPLADGSASQAALRHARTRVQLGFESVLSQDERRDLPNHFVIGSARGGAFTPSLLGRGFSTIARSLDLRGTTGKVVCLHDLRHTLATYLVARGVDIKTVAFLMGHADAAMTLNIYASADPKARLQAAEIIASSMAERPEEPVIADVPTQ